MVGIRKFQVLQEHDDPEFIDAILQDSHRMISCALQLIVYFVYVSSLADGAGDRIGSELWCAGVWKLCCFLPRVPLPG